MDLLLQLYARVASLYAALWISFYTCLNSISPPPLAFPEKAIAHPEYVTESLKVKRQYIHHIISHIANFPISEHQPKTSVTRAKSILCSISCRVSKSALTSPSIGCPKRLLHALSETSRFSPFIQPVSSAIIPSCISLVTWIETSRDCWTPQCEDSV